MQSQSAAFFLRGQNGGKNNQKVQRSCLGESWHAIRLTRNSSIFWKFCSGTDLKVSHKPGELIIDFEL